MKQQHIEDFPDFIVITNPRRKHFALMLNQAGKLLVKAPPGAQQKDIEKVIKKHLGWIKKQQHKHQQTPQKSFTEGSLHWLWGQRYPLDIRQSLKSQVDFINNHIQISTTNPDHEEHIEQQLKKLYRQQALTIFPERLEAIYQQIKYLGLPRYNKLTIRHMRTRWGSCSSQRNISLNLELVKLEPIYLDYIITHELCHLKQMNHGPKFYALMDQAMSDWPARRKQLKQVKL